MLERVFYVSCVSPRLTTLDVQRILSSSVIRNRRLDVTGVLTRCGEYFAQVLEGRSEAIDEILNSLYRDSRHNGVHIIFRMRITTRDYAEWAMGWADSVDTEQMLARLYSEGADDQSEADTIVRKLFTRPLL